MTCTLPLSLSVSLSVSLSLFLTEWIVFIRDLSNNQLKTIHPKLFAKNQMLTSL